MRLASIFSVMFLLAFSQAVTANPEFWKFEWKNTDFSKTIVPSWTEIMSGGPPKDGIPAISDPNFLSVAEETRLHGNEGVIAVEIDGEIPRAYPLRYLMWHEIVNDVVGDQPIAVTYCPLCNSAIVFDRMVNGEMRTFGVSGKLRNSDMVMYDRETESWWQQAQGLGIVGDHVGDELTVLPTWLESWEEFSTRNPDGAVMGQPPWPRNYGLNPYAGYDRSRRPFLYNGEEPPHGIPSLMRVVRVGERAWPMQRLRDLGEVTEAGVTITWQSGQASALDKAKLEQGWDVGSIRVRDADGEDVVHDVLFAFAFHAFWPEGEWMLGN